MSAQLLDGKKVSQSLLDELAQEVLVLKQKFHMPPKLVVVLVGEDSASQVYVKKKAQAAEKLGILSDVMHFPSNLSEKELVGVINSLNHDASVHGILLQLPLPRQIDALKILCLISPEKDVDGFHPVNQGRLLSGDLPPALPCTPAGILHLLDAYHLPIAGKHVVVVGRSNIVGKPLGLLLLQRNATVTFCHSHTQDLESITRQADILVAAIGKPQMIHQSHVAPGTVVIDVGVNRLSSGKLVGDVHFDEVAPIASWITPVPGGVGPMTIAMLMKNTLGLYKAKNQLEAGSSL